MTRLFTALIPLILLSGCPESSEPVSGDPGGEEGGSPDNGGDGPTPFSNPNDARFSVAPGTGVVLSGTFDYTSESPGSYRIDIQKRETPNSPHPSRGNPVVIAVRESGRSQKNGTTYESSE